MKSQGKKVEVEAGIMTVHDVANYLRFSEGKVYRMANGGQIPAIRMGKTWRFRKDLIDEWFRKVTELSLHAADPPGWRQNGVEDDLSFFGGVNGDDKGKQQE